MKTAKDIIRAVLVKPQFNATIKQDMLCIMTAAYRSSNDKNEQLCTLLDKFQGIYLKHWKAENPMLIISPALHDTFIEVIAEYYPDILADWFSCLFPEKKELFYTIYKGEKTQ